jgi:hypothetical protein
MTEFEDELSETCEDGMEFSETPEGEAARERWARRYDALNGAPESEYDR